MAPSILASMRSTWGWWGGLVPGQIFFLPQNGWILAAPVWLAVMALLRSRRLLDLSWFSLGSGRDECRLRDTRPRRLLFLRPG